MTYVSNARQVHSTHACATVIVMWRWVQDARFHRAVVLDSPLLCARGLMALGDSTVDDRVPSINVPLSPAYRPNCPHTSIAPQELIIDMTGEDRVHVPWAALD